MWLPWMDCWQEHHDGFVYVFVYVRVHVLGGDRLMVEVT